MSKISGQIQVPRGTDQLLQRVHQAVLGQSPEVRNRQEEESQVPIGVRKQFLPWRRKVAPLFGFETSPERNSTFHRRPTTAAIQKRAGSMKRVFLGGGKCKRSVSFLIKKGHPRPLFCLFLLFSTTILLKNYRLQRDSYSDGRIRRLVR